MQTDIPFPMLEPDSVVASVKSDAHAIKLSIDTAAVKQAALARELGISAGYLSLIRNGKRPVPDSMVDLFCAKVGSSLLKQYRDFQAALRLMRGEGVDDADNKLVKTMRAARAVVRHVR
jgi:transcriptional regulator with XRE-family HTH domain